MFEFAEIFDVENNTPLYMTTLQRNFDFVFPEKELRGLSPNFHIHVSAGDLYIPVIGPPIFLQQNMQTDGGNISIVHRNMNVPMNWDCSRSVPFRGIQYMFRIFGIVFLQCMGFQ